MKPFVLEDGVAVPFDQADVDTDQILPARYLRRPRQGGYGTFLVRDVRFNDDDSERPDFILNQLPYRNATIMVADRNFGCGSSREHAPQALMRWGIRAVIGESFAEIFFGNCLALGIPCLTASPADAAALQRAIAATPAALLRLDLEALRVQLDPQASDGTPASASLDQPLQLAEGPHRMLVSGQWDGTSQLVAHDAELRATASCLPYLAGFGD
jgi:3-isopropylmalate/(R)-2-methylmalate dehydratase small subunit